MQIKTSGNHIITTQIEHPAVLNTCKKLEQFGFRVTYLKPEKNGIINVKELERNITRNTILISVMAANNEIGTIQPISEIGKIAKKYGIFFHTDAVQAIGNIKIDVKDMNIGALSMSGHKFYGPKGVGVAYINEKIPFIRIQDGGHQERDKRAATENVPGIVGLGIAIEKADNELYNYNNKLLLLRNYFFDEIIRRIKNVRINGDIENRLPGNANICLPGYLGKDMVTKLDEEEICVSSGSACSAGFITPSHVLLAIDLPASLARSSIRVTFGKENTKEDVDFLINSIEKNYYM